MQGEDTGVGRYKVELPRLSIGEKFMDGMKK